jgi:hypothetical protein
MKYLAIFGFGLLVTVAGAQVTKQSGGYLLRAKYTQGSVFKQKIETSMSGSLLSNAKESTVYTSKVVKVEKNGNATVEVSTTATKNRKPFKQVLELNTLGVPIKGGIPGYAGNLGLPEKAVKVGQKWKGDVAAQSGVSVAAEYTLKSVSNGLAQIQVSMISTGPLDMKGGGSYFVRMKDGQIQNSTLKFTVAQFDPNQKKKLTSDIVLKITRI